MRIEATATSLSWIPSESVWGAMRQGFKLGLAHWDDPLPDSLTGAEQVWELCHADKFRFGNLLSAWVEVEDDKIVDAGVGDDSGLVMGSTTIRVGKLGATFRAISLPVLRPRPELSDDQVRFVQTVGGATGVPLPRPVPHPPYVQWQAPLVWTTLALTIRADGSSVVELDGASTFPRHWIYGTDGRITLKSGLTDQDHWISHSFGKRTPWGDQDREALVVAVESELERSLSQDIMRGGASPEVRRLPAGAALTRQGEPGDELYLVLDGIVSVDVDGTSLGELGPGAVLGERALLEGGTRTSTLTAVTPVRVAVAAAESIDMDRLRTLADSHRREDDGDTP
jgi:hypothetical protein